MAKHSQIPALIKGVGNYTAGVSQTLAGSNMLVAKNNDLNAGATKLANGVDELGAKIPKLTQGITALYNGTQKLKNNSLCSIQAQAKSMPVSASSTAKFRPLQAA